MDAPRHRRSPTRTGRSRSPESRSIPGLRASAVLFLLCALPGAASAQAPGTPSVGERGIGLEASGGVSLAVGGLAAVADPGLSAGFGASVPVASSVNVRIDGGIGLPARDAAAGPLIDVYSGLLSIEYVAQQEEPGSPPLRTALSLGGGMSVLEAVQMPAAAPAGATFSESYPTLTAGARLGYPLTSGLVLYVAPRVKWFDLPAGDWSRLTRGLGVAAPENGWVVPVRAGIRIGL